MNSATIAAVYTFAAHHHSGQGSRGYRLLCAADRAWRRKTGIAPRLAFWERLVEHVPHTGEGAGVRRQYWRLVKAHRDSV